MPQLSSEASDFSWLVDNFAKRTPGVAHARVVSADGLPIAVSQRAGSSCDVGVVAYEMTVLVSRTGDVLTPALRTELQAALPP